MQDNEAITTNQRLRTEFTLAQLDEGDRKAAFERRRRQKLTLRQTTRYCLREKSLANAEIKKLNDRWKAQKDTFALKLSYRPKRTRSQRYYKNAQHEFKKLQHRWSQDADRLEKFHKHIQHDIRNRGTTLTGEFRKNSVGDRARVRKRIP